MHYHGLNTTHTTTHRKRPNQRLAPSQVSPRPKGWESRRRSESLSQMACGHTTRAARYTAPHTHARDVLCLMRRTACTQSKKDVLALAPHPRTFTDGYKNRCHLKTSATRTQTAFRDCLPSRDTATNKRRRQTHTETYSKSVWREGRANCGARKRITAEINREPFFL
jgi:hypothetical protein